MFLVYIRVEEKGKLLELWVIGDWLSKVLLEDKLIDLKNLSTHKNFIKIGPFG